LDLHVASFATAQRALFLPFLAKPAQKAQLPIGALCGRSAETVNAVRSW